MDEIRETVLRLMRTGKTADTVCLFLDTIREELETAKDYIYATKEGDMQP